MNKGLWILLGIGGAIGTLYCGYKWFKSAAQNNSLSRQNDYLQRKSSNEAEQNNTLRQQNASITKEKNELKNQIAKLSLQLEAPAQTT